MALPMAHTPSRSDPPADALDLLGSKGDAERALTAALASFQAQVQPVPSLDLAAVMEAARPAFSHGIAFCSQLLQEQGRRRLRVTLMHRDGAELYSEEWADDLDDLAQASGWMLAMLMGIPVRIPARATEPDQEADRVADVAEDAPVASEQVVESAPEAEAAGDPDDPLLPLSAEEIETWHRRILALPVEARRTLTSAFREHFQVPRSARSIGDRITQRRHGEFLACFFQEQEDTP